MEETQPRRRLSGEGRNANKKMVTGEWAGLGRGKLTQWDWATGERRIRDVDQCL